MKRENLDTVIHREKTSCKDEERIRVMHLWLRNVKDCQKATTSYQEGLDLILPHSPRRHQTLCRHDLGFSVSRTATQYISLLRPPSLVYAVSAALVTSIQVKSLPPGTPQCGAEREIEN